MSKKLKVGFWLDDGAYMPTKGYDTDAGLDLRTPGDMNVFPNESRVIDTGVHLLVPEGWCGLIVAKSSLNIDNALNVTGLVDCNFTGTIKVRVYNHNQHNVYTFDNGDKVAQIMFVEVPKLNLVYNPVTKDGVRGVNGYGSTGR